MLSQLLAQESRQLAEERAEALPVLPPHSPVHDHRQSPRQSPLDAAVDQMLRDLPGEDDADYNSRYREELDLSRLLHLQQNCDSGDTLVIVNFPRGYMNCKNEEWTSKRFYAHSKKLLATDSKVFANLFSPRKQTRFRQRFEQDGESIPQKFIIDLTPSVEGDELAAQLMDLSLPVSVRHWWTSKERLGISPYLVSGHDDHCPRHNEVFVDCKKKNGYVERKLGTRERLPTIDLSDIEMPESRDIVDYCPIRHRANIIRLILAIEGHELVLNSAPRVYTLTGIASILDCTDVVRDPVCTWLMAEPNTEFIDINPEVAFKIAWTLRLTSIARAAFRILVVEKALDALDARPPTQKVGYTIFGRPRVDLPDDLQTAVQYAAHKLADRVQQTLAKLRSDQFYDLFKISEYQKLMVVGDVIKSALSIGPAPNDRPTSSADFLYGHQLTRLFELFNDLYKLLHEYRDWVLKEALVSVSEYGLQSDFDRNRRCYVPPEEWAPTALICSSFSDAQHLLTPWFWENLAKYPQASQKMCFPDWYLDQRADEFNSELSKVAPYVLSDRMTEIKLQDFRFDAEQFRNEIADCKNDLWIGWVAPHLEVPLTRTKHMVLALSEEEFKYLPLWAGGLNDGSGGVFQSAVPDSDLGPIGPGPAYRTGNTVATDASSIYPSEATPSQVSTATMTVGRSVVAAPSNMGPSTVHDATSVGGNRAASASAATVDEDDDDDDDDDDGDDTDDFDFNDNDEIDEEAWSQVEEH